MRYTHIGLLDQARALAALPAPANSSEVPSQRGSQHPGSADGQTGAKPGTARHNTKKKPEASNPSEIKGSDTPGQSVAEPGTGSAEWRRRESNANGDFPNDRDAQELVNSAESESTVGPRTGVFDCREVAVYPSNDSLSALDYIAWAWPRLQPHVREAIITLIDCVGGAGMTESARD